MSKTVIGCGYLGLRIARIWRGLGETVHTLTRSSDRAQVFAAEGFEPIVGDIADAGFAPELPVTDTLLMAVGYDRSQPASIDEVYVAGFRRVLDRLCEPFPRIIYISSTGVYGQGDGGWIDETSPTNPIRDGGKACLAAEQLLAEHPAGKDSVVLRLAGIYGPGRIPRQKELLAGEPIAAVDGYLNLIHVEDAAEIAVQAASHSQPSALYLVADNEPVHRHEYFREMARLIDAPQPTFVEPATGTPQAARGAASKRANNQRLRAEIYPEFKYPTFREGLQACLAAES